MLDGKPLNSKRLFPLVPTVMWAVVSSFALFQFFIQLSSGVMVKELMENMHLSSFGAGLLVSSYYYVYVTLQTPAGLLLDRYGVRRLLTLGSLVTALGCVLFAGTGNIPLMVVGRMLMGGGTAFAFVGTLAIIRMWFPKNRFAFMVGVTETIGMVGAMVGDVFLAKLIETVGWQDSMRLAGFISIIFVAICWFVLRDKRNEEETPSIEKGQFLAGFWQIIKMPQAWLNGIYCGLVFSVATVFVALWGVPYIMKDLGVGLTLATGIDNIVFLGIAIGCPFVGWIYGRYGKRRPIMVITALGSAVVMSIILYVPTQSPYVLGALLFLLGGICSGYILNFTFAEEFSPANAGSTCIGFTNTLAMITAPILQPVIGLILDAAAKQHGGTEMGVYQLSDYKLALTVIPVMLCIAAVIAYFIPEKDETTDTSGELAYTPELV